MPRKEKSRLPASITARQFGIFLAVYFHASPSKRGALYAFTWRRQAKIAAQVIVCSG
ncbi:hypothetical protein ACZ87_02200 [Candidatus Erwinia dacicola]|uniref:Uncharacterized protein n=1 Tax=Candidatus Erwinia dacicola TaxID=252393 RepID=A0A328TPI5_9GAMM|nr:hypothetical protein ACZ87_02200 [Candidatus Erwinia dacicola]